MLKWCLHFGGARTLAFGIGAYIASVSTASHASATTASISPAEEDVAPVWKIVLTGGPCGGKSSGMEMISKTLKKEGIDVFTVPEAASLLIIGNNRFDPNVSEDEQVLWQENLVRIQMALEDAQMAGARMRNKPAVVLCDRGVLDSKAYMGSEMWKALMSRMGKTTPEMREGRYDAVIHLVTAAKGAEEAYNNNNPARSSNPERARMMDSKVMDAYVGHPTVHIIHNNGMGFQEKLDRTVDAVRAVVGRPHSIKSSFFAVQEVEIPAVVAQETARVRDYYLDDGARVRLRNYASDGYTHCRVQHLKQPSINGVLKERICTSTEAQLAATAFTIDTERTDFVWNDTSYSLYRSLDTSVVHTILEARCSENEALPPFVKSIAENSGCPLA